MYLDQYLIPAILQLNVLLFEFHVLLFEFHVLLFGLHILLFELLLLLRREFETIQFRNDLLPEVLSETLPGVSAMADLVAVQQFGKSFQKRQFWSIFQSKIKIGQKFSR